MNLLMPCGYTDHCSGVCLPDRCNNSLVISLTGETSPHLMFKEAPQEDVDQLECTKESSNHLSREMQLFSKRKNLRRM